MIGPYHHIKTDAFRQQAEDGRPDQERSGMAFARWLASEFHERGETRATVRSENFGWSVTLRREPFVVRVECGSRDENLSDWGAYVVAQPSLAQRMFSRIEVQRQVDRLSKLLGEIVKSAPGTTPPPEE